MNTRLRAPKIFIVALFCLLITSASGVENPQDKSAASSGEKVYGLKEVDVKAVVDGNSKVNNGPSVAGCKGEGSVLLRVVLHSSGKVTDVEVKREGDCKQYRERAVKSVRKVKFTPARKDGVAVSQYAMFEYNYRVW